MKLGDGGVSAKRNTSWASTHARTAAGAICTAISRTIAPPHSAYSAWRKTATRWPRRADLERADLEEAIIAAKGAGGMVRTHGRMEEHPQAAAIAALPLLEIVRIGDSPPEPLPAGDRPLSGIRVLDLTRVLAGPTCARTLAEHGADVMKITGAHLPNLGYQEFDTGHGKLSAQLDLREPRRCRYPARPGARGRRVLARLSPGHAGHARAVAEELAALRPGLVYVSLSAFSHAGPWASRRGFDTVVQTVSGITTPPGRNRAGQDTGTAILPRLGDRLLHRLSDGVRRDGRPRPPRREGGSWLVRISLAQVGKWIVDLGEVPAAAARDAPAEFTPDELERWSTVSDTPSGRLRHLKPVVQLSETPPYWARPSVPLGYHQPVWPPRASA